MHHSDKRIKNRTRNFSVKVENQCVPSGSSHYHWMKFINLAREVQKWFQNNYFRTSFRIAEEQLHMGNSGMPWWVAMHHHPTVESSIWSTRL